MVRNDVQNDVEVAVHHRDDHRTSDAVVIPVLLSPDGDGAFELLRKVGFDVAHALGLHEVDEQRNADGGADRVGEGRNVPHLRVGVDT